MKRSRKKTNRAKVRKRRQIRDQREREQHRTEKKYVPEKFVFWRFLKQRKIELLLVIVMIAGITGIVFLGPDKGAINEVKTSVSSVIEEQSGYWEETYPYGYKIIALRGKDIIHTSYDTLPEGLEINWRNLSAVRIQATQFGSTEEKIKIKIPDINYAPEAVSGLTATVAFIRRKGVTTSLAQLGDLRFIVEIIEDTGDQVFCLFGLQDG